MISPQPESLEELSSRIADGISDLLPPNTPWTPTAQWVADLITHSARCCDCRRPLHTARSIAAGRGPVCQAKRGRS